MSDIEKTSRSANIGSDVIPPDEVRVGQWYWVKRSDPEYNDWLGCCINIGSNYVELDGPEGGPQRIHFDNFEDRCKLEPDPDGVINREVLSRQTEVQRLMTEVHRITDRLALSASPELGTGEECRALAVATNGQTFGDYSKALEKAKKEDLPALFKKIASANEGMARWMSAKVIPLKAEAEKMQGVIEKIEDRVFNVELYAGLTERVVVCQDGEPAHLGEPIRLLQRRHYMDEESLVRYKAGGMEYQDIKDFDRWICQPENRDRLLPFPRCVVAFQVRRNTKWRSIARISDYIQMFDLEDADKTTFLYIRNGDQVFRLSTKIEFGPQLFPDIRQLHPNDKIYAKMWGSQKVDKIISEGEYLEMVKEWEEAEQERKEKYKNAPKEDRFLYQFPTHSEWREYRPFEHSNVYYDDINADVQGKLKRHNRIALVLQGLLDRSPVFHPHPPWQIWTEAGFQQAFELLYDDSHALVSGPPPDFEAYRKRLNQSLKVGSVTIGQELAWAKAEAIKENNRDRRQRRDGLIYRTYHPYGNPGPGHLAKPTAVSRSGKCTFEWTRERRVSTWEHRYGDPIPARFTVDSEHLLCVDAYQPGDFRQFFDDPRTRAHYLKWAPLLLEAEEYHAGNRKVGEPGPRSNSYARDDEDEA